jgi:hypothetical protein
MPSVATFYQFQDKTPVGLVAGGSPVTLTQTVTVTPTSGAVAVLTWMAQRTSTAAVGYTVSLNSVVINTYSVSTVGATATGQPTEMYAMQVSFKTPPVIQGPNVLTFTIVGLTGTLVISDVMLWVPVDVA